ncbi:MAG: hypothetical protein JWP97_6034, partial [Labilithrix sp.]|nr:hypothetical protein [Labilithrix sp.]
ALGARVGAETRRGAVAWSYAALSLLVLGLAFAVGAWAASGMETGLATALATLAVTRLSARTASWQPALLAGLAATLRPELVVWAVALAAGAATVARANGGPERPAARRAVVAVVLAAGPFALCALVRLVVFGRPAPLAVLAKPSDLSHGLVYAAAGLLVVLTPLLVLAPVALWRRRGAPLAIVLAFAAHVLVIVAVGGDWMPYARLFVPVTPSLVLAAVLLEPHQRASFAFGRVAAALVVGALVARQAAPAGRTVGADRADLVRRARPVLASAHVVAALDVGWVSASVADDARIVDLAGLTDPQIALLPGGHTSKRVDVAMLLDRNVDAVLVYSEPRVVELRLLRAELFAARFESREQLPLGARGAFYTVYRRRALAP